MRERREAMLGGDSPLEFVFQVLVLVAVASAMLRFGTIAAEHHLSVGTFLEGAS